MDVLKRIVLGADDVDVSIGMRRELAKCVSDNLNAFIDSMIEDPWYIFDEGKEEAIGVFHIYLDPEREIPLSISLAGLVDRTVTCNNDKEFHKALADEFERQANILRNS